MYGEHETHTLELFSCTEDGVAEWFCPTCGRHMLLRLEPTLMQTLLAEGDTHASHSSRVGGVQLEAVQRMAAEPLRAAEAMHRSGSTGAEATPFGIDAFGEFGEPDPRDGMDPWIAFLKRLG